MLENFISPYSSTVYEKLSSSGTVNLGKTNMDEFAMGSSNETSFFGSVLNPIDPEKSAGRFFGRFSFCCCCKFMFFCHRNRYRGLDRQPAAFVELQE